MKRFVIVNFNFEATHHWENCNIPDVFFLRFPHRHRFHVTAKKRVSHNDREVEIIMLQRAMLAYVRKEIAAEDSVPYSCEDIAEKLFLEFYLESCTVLEDGENGAMVEKE